MIVRAAFFDVDGTLVRGHVWSAILAHPDVSRARVWRLYASLLPRWFASKLHLVSQMGFRSRWVQGLALLLAGWERERVERMNEWVAEEFLADRYRDDVVEFLRQHKERGDYVILVSTMFEGTTMRIAKRLGADAGLGSVLEFSDGICTGKISGEPCVGSRKLDFIRAHLAARDLSVDLSEASAYAGSFSDAPLLAAVGHPTAVYPQKELLKTAEERGWAS